MIYNIPSRCMVNIPPAELAQLAEIENVVAVKQANDDDLGPVPGLELLAGNDNVLFRCLEVGGSGGICVASHLVGNEMSAVCEAAAAGDLDRARKLDGELQPLYEALAVTSNPIPVKTAMAMLGLCSDKMRLPMVPANEQQRSTIRAALARQGLQAAA